MKTVKLFSWYFKKESEVTKSCCFRIDRYSTQVKDSILEYYKFRVVFYLYQNVTGYI